MIGIVYLKSNNQIISIVPDVQSNTDTDIIGKDASVKGIDLTLASFCIVDSTTQKVGDTLDTTPLLAWYKQQKIAEINAKVGAKIISGYQSNIILASTKKAHLYGTMLTDQQNISATYARMNANSTLTVIKHRPQDVTGFVDHTRDEWKIIAEAIDDFVRGYLDKGYTLKRRVEAAATIADVNAIQVVL